MLHQPLGECTPSVPGPSLAVSQLVLGSKDEKRKARGATRIPLSTILLGLVTAVNAVSACVLLVQNLIADPKP